MTIHGLRVSFVWLFVALWVLGAAYSPQASAQGIPAEGVITVVRGQSELLVQAQPVERVSIGDPEIADAVVISPREVLVNARSLGTTTLILWDVSGNRNIYSVQVTADAAALERQLRTIFPGEPISVTASGNMVVLSGRVSSTAIAERALEIARGTGATIIGDLDVPPAQQVLLQVRFAEVSRSAAQRLGTDFIAGETGVNLNPADVAGDGDFVAETLSDGLLRLFLFEDNIQASVVIQALKSRGIFRSLAEPNLLALEGTEAEFLAGGEFPYPAPQPGQAGNAVTIEFKEFGVRLQFIPTVTASGRIRLAVAPEVSSLDFANGLQVSGFQIPSVLTRRASTQVELLPGQTFAIAGLMDNTITDNASKIPFLGDIPILGALFRSTDVRQNRTELLVLVTPHLVQPTDVAPPLPTGEPETWEWDSRLRDRSIPEEPSSPR